LKRIITVIIALILSITPTSVRAEQNTSGSSSGSGGGGIQVPVPDYQFVNAAIPQSMQLSKYHDICYGNGVFVCLASTYIERLGGYFPAVAISQNGYIWQTYRADVLGPITGIEFDGTRFIAYSHNTYDSIYAISLDGINWTRHEFFEQGQEITQLGLSVTFKDNKAYMSISRDGNSTIYKNSRDANTWLYDEWSEVYSAQDCYIEDLKCLDGELIAVGTNGFIITSTDGMTWNKVPDITTNKTLRAVANLNDQLLVFGTPADNVCDSLVFTRNLDGVWEIKNVENNNFQAILTVTPYAFFRAIIMGLQQIFYDGENWINLSEGPSVWTFAANEDVIVEMTDNELFAGTRTDEFSSRTYISDNNGVSIDWQKEYDSVINNVFVFNPDSLDCAIISTMYDKSNKLVSTQIRTKEDWEKNFTAQFTFENFTPQCEIKTFFWNNINSMQPIGDKKINNSYDAWDLGNQ